MVKKERQTMFKIERIQKIKELLLERRQMEVSTLSTLLKVSDATIRNDLEELENEGFLTRFHGGAALNYAETSGSVNVFDNAMVPYDRNKEEIGFIAAKSVREREWVFLGPGTTTYYIAKALAHRSNISILTNSFLVINALKDSPHIKIMFLGGRFQRPGFYAVPDDLESEMDNIYLDKAFFSVDGLDLCAGYTLSDIAVLKVIQCVKKHSQETIMAIDSTKFDQRSFRKVCGIDDIKTVVTNPDFPEQYRQFFSLHHISVYSI